VGQKGPITVSDVLEVMRLQISVVECDVFAYPSIESDLVLLIMPVTRSPTALQVNYSFNVLCRFNCLTRVKENVRHLIFLYFLTDDYIVVLRNSRVHSL
jgi:hypothetical protein